MLETDSTSNTIFIKRNQQEKDFCAFLLRWQKLLLTSFPPTTQSTLLLSPQQKIQGAVILLFGDSGLGKSTLLKRYHALATSSDFSLEVASIIDWRLLEGIEHSQFTISSSQEADPVLYFNRMHYKLADALAKQPKNLRKQLYAFKAYESAMAEVRVVREQVSRLIRSLRTEERYGPLIWLTDTNGQVGAGMLKIMRWCFEEPWSTKTEADIQALLESYIGKNTGLDKKHLSQLREALDNTLSKDLYMYLYPEQCLAYALGNDLRIFARQRPLLLFFDSYEHIAGGDNWLQGIMKAAGRAVGWVIAGQENVWSKEEQKANAGAFSAGPQRIYGYQDIVATDSLLTIDFAHSSAGTFSIGDILEYFTQLHKENPSLKKIGRPTAKRIFEATGGMPLMVCSIASSYAQKRDLHTLLESAERDMVQVYVMDTPGDDEMRKRLFGLVLLRRTNNASVVRSMLNLHAQPEQSYKRALQQLHNCYHFIAIEQDQPVVHEKVQYILRHWLLFQGKNTTEFSPVVKHLETVQLTQLQSLERAHVYRNLREHLEDDEWVNTYLDLVEACFWLSPEAGFFSALTGALAAILYRPDMLYEIKRISAFFKKTPSFQDTLLQHLLAEPPDATTPASLTWLQELHDQLARALFRPSTSEGQSMDYKRGLDALKAYVRDSEVYSEFLTYEGRLRETLRKEDRYGTNEQIRSTRVEVISRLNDLAYNFTGNSFNDFCLMLASFPGKYACELEGALWWLQGKLSREETHAPESTILDYYNQALALLPGHSELKEDYAYTCLMLATKHFAQKSYQSSITYLNKAIRIKDDYVDAYYSLGNTFYELEYYERACAQYQYTILLDESYLPAFINLGNTYSILKRFEDAIAEYTVACSLDSHNYLLYYNRGNSYVELKRYQEALEDFTRAILLNPGCADAYLNRGNVYGLSGRYADARADYRQARALNPPHINYVWMDVWASFGKVFHEGEVQEQLETLVALEPQHYLSSLCQAMLGALQQQKLHMITPLLERAFQQEAEQWDTYFWKGMIFAFYQQTKEAKEAIEQALALGLPPLLLIPLCWLEPVVPGFFQTYAQPLLEHYRL